MSTFAEYDAELDAALAIITGGLRRESDELRRDRVPSGANSYQIRQSAQPLVSEDGNTVLNAHGTTIVVYHYLDRDPNPVESERDYTLVDMQTMQGDILFKGLWIPGWPLAPAYALTTVRDFWNETEPVIPVTFERVGRVISFQIEVAITLAE